MRFLDHTFGDTLVRYLVDDNNNVAMQLIPATMADALTTPWEHPELPFNPRADYVHNWEIGSLAHLHMEQDQFCNAGQTMHVAAAMRHFTLEDQTVCRDGNTTAVITTLWHPDGYRLSHTLTYHEGLRGFSVQTAFENHSGNDVVIDMLSSFVMDGLSPFHDDDAPGAYRFHKYHAGWSLEGKHVCTSLEEMGLEKPWVSWLFTDNCERIGCKGGYPVERYFPTAVFEDTKHHVLWAAQIAHNTTWQMELGRIGDYLSFRGGLGDREFCGWKKTIRNGERFTAPTAFIAVAIGDIHDACAAVTDMQKSAQRAYGEIGLPTSFNEYCATWGKPTQEKMLNYCRLLTDFGIKYLVIDAGWCKAGNEQSGNGEWEPDPIIFPDMKAMNAEIRRNGMIPGIWLEFEVTTQGSRFFEHEYDAMKLHRDGRVIKANNIRSFWDFRRADVREHLYKKVIAFLREYDFGYIKVDYNANLGSRVDGGDSDAEGLREHFAGVYEFFRLMKQELPDLVIENCASGGHRLEPLMMGATAISSFSDAHEAIEIPYIAANLHSLMLPAQELIWATLHGDDSHDRLCYSLAATFLGRVCLSGPIEELNEEQRRVVKESMQFYDGLTDILVNGDTRIYGNRGGSIRHPTGTQAVVRRTAKEILVVCHAYREPSAKPILVDLGTNAVVKVAFNNRHISVENNVLRIDAMQPLTAEAVVLTIE